LFNPHIIVKKANNDNSAIKKYSQMDQYMNQIQRQGSMWFVKSFAAETLHPENP